MKSFGLIMSAAVSIVASLLLGEIFLRGALFGYYLLYNSQNDNCGDACPMIFAIILGFIVKPVISVVLAIIIFLLSVAKTKIPVHNNTAKIAFTETLVGVLVLTISVVSSAIETGISISEIPGIYFMFTK